ncbi:MAG TPA: hypothetical protein DCQ43_08050 [Treponema sp.]|nr:hypothetical protein [Treponema sp.]
MNRKMTCSEKRMLVGFIVIFLATPFLFIKFFPVAVLPFFAGLALCLVNNGMSEIIVTETTVSFFQNFKTYSVDLNQIDVFKTEVSPGNRAWMIVLDDGHYFRFFPSRKNYDVVQFILSHAHSTKTSPLQFYEQLLNTGFAEDWYLTPPE